MKNLLISTFVAILVTTVGIIFSPAVNAQTKVSLVGRALPSLGDLANDKYGELVRYGHGLATQTFKYIGPEVSDKKMRYAGNNLACTSCHESEATKPYAMPWIGITASFPQYRGREDDISTLEERVNGCMERSMAGKSLPYDSREMKAFIAYFHFLSKDIPVGAAITEAGVFMSKAPNRKANLVDGEKVYVEKCAVCHQVNGEGVRAGAKGSASGYIFPPVWGDDSYNDGAGMHRVVMAMRYIKHNMPRDAVSQLTDDEAYDVAAYINTKPRPHRKNLEADFPARWNKPVDSAFPPYVYGAPAEQHKLGPFPPLAEIGKTLAKEYKEGKRWNEKTNQWQ